MLWEVCWRFSTWSSTCCCGIPVCVCWLTLVQKCTKSLHTVPVNIKKLIVSPFSASLALLVMVAEPLCCFAHPIKTEQQIPFTSVSFRSVHLTLTCPPRSHSGISKTSSLEAPPGARIRTPISQAIQTASSISQRELSRRRTCECKCDRLTGHDWHVKPVVNCIPRLTLMWNLLGCNTVGGVKRLTYNGIVVFNTMCCLCWHPAHAFIQEMTVCK